MTPTDIEKQVGAAAGLWTHTPVDWQGPALVAKPASWPTDAYTGYWGDATGSRPGQVVFIAVPPASGVPILSISLTALTTTTASITFTLGSTPTATSVKYGTTTAVGSSAAGTTATSQTVALSGLTTKTYYYFQVTATNASGTTTSSLLAFTTL